MATEQMGTLRREHHHSVNWFHVVLSFSGTRKITTVYGLHMTGI